MESALISECLMVIIYMKYMFILALLIIAQNPLPCFIEKNFEQERYSVLVFLVCRES